MENVLDIISRPLTEEDLKPSLFIDGSVVLFEVAKGELVQDVDEITGENKAHLDFTLVTCNETPNNRGKSFPVGYPYHHRIHLRTTSKKGKDITEMVTRRLAEWRAGCGLPLNQSFGQPEDYVGKRVTALMRIKSDEQYGQQNEIKKFVPPSVAA